MRIGLISDTHNYLDPLVYKYFDEVDEIWHAGDIGTNVVTDALAKFKPLRAVYGNIDGHELRAEFPEDLIFEVNGLKVYLTHIGGKPYVYNKRIIPILNQENPNLFICGHSHICLAQFDKKRRMTCLNPGAAGVHGFHKIKTLMRFTVSQGKLSDLEVVELGARAK